MGAARITGRPFHEGVYLFYGAGEVRDTGARGSTLVVDASSAQAGVGIANLIAFAMSRVTGRPIDEERGKVRCSSPLST